MWVTVTKHNFIPYEGVVNVIVTSGPFMICDHYEIDDSFCNNNGTVQPGETIKLPVTIQNVGVDTANQVVAILRTANTYIIITDSTENYGTVMPDSYKLGEFVFNVASSAPQNYHDIEFELVMNDTNNISWVSHFSIPVIIPILKFYFYLIDDDSLGESQGDCDKFIERGETIELPLSLRNFGDIPGHNVSAALSSYDTFVTIIDSIEDFGDIQSENIGFTFDDFGFRIKRNCPINHSVAFYLRIYDEDNFTNDWLDTIYISSGEPGSVAYKLESTIDNPVGVASDGDKLWISSGYSNHIYVINPVDGNVIKTITAPSSSCMDLAWANGFLWVHGGVPDRQIYKIDTTGNLLQGFPSPAQNPYGIAFDGEHIFAADYSGIIFELDTDGNVISSFTIPVPSGGAGKGLAFEQSSQNLMIMVSFGYDSCKVYEIRRNGSIVQTHAFNYQSVGGSGVDCDLLTGDYWLVCYPGGPRGEILRVEGFYPWPPTPSADIRVNPDSLVVELQPNDTTSQMMRIKNIGKDTLIFSINELIDVSWLAETPTQCELAPNDSVDITVSYNTSGLAPDSTYNASIEIVSNDPDESIVSVPVVLTVTLGTEESLQLPKIFAMRQNLPNPFSQETAIIYELPLRGEGFNLSSARLSSPKSTDGRGEPVKSRVSIKVYDITGSLVRTLVDETQKAGYYTVRWDTRNDAGDKVASGIYFYHISAKCGEAVAFTSVRKAILIR